MVKSAAVDRKRKGASKAELLGADGAASTSVTLATVPCFPADPKMASFMAALPDGPEHDQALATNTTAATASAAPATAGLATARRPFVPLVAKKNMGGPTAPLPGMSWADDCCCHPMWLQH